MAKGIRGGAAKARLCWTISRLVMVIDYSAPVKS
jgi:hypothetical protein